MGVMEIICLLSSGAGCIGVTCGARKGITSAVAATLSFRSWTCSPVSWERTRPGCRVSLQ